MRPSTYSVLQCYGWFNPVDVNAFLFSCHLSIFFTLLRQGEMTLWPSTLAYREFCITLMLLGYIREREREMSNITQGIRVRHTVTRPKFEIVTLFTVRWILVPVQGTGFKFSCDNVRRFCTTNWDTKILLIIENFILLDFISEKTLLGENCPHVTIVSVF